MISEENIDALINAIVSLIDDWHAGRHEMWHRMADTERARAEFKEALRACLDQSKNG